MKPHELGDLGEGMRLAPLVDYAKSGSFFHLTVSGSKSSQGPEFPHQPQK